MYCHTVGEQVPVEITVDNLSGSKITEVKARIGENVLYRSNGGSTRSGYEKVSEVAEGTKRGYIFILTLLKPRE